MLKKSFTILTVVLAVLFLFTLSWADDDNRRKKKRAEILYGVRGSWGLGAPADLIIVNPATGGLVKVIGLTGLSGVGGLAINPLDGTIYACGGGDNTPGLHTLNPKTGAATLIGGEVTVKDMGFDSSGTLYAVIADPYDETGNNGKLATINLTTGAISPIGGSFIYGVGLAFDSNDTLYIKEGEQLHIVNPSNGSVLDTVELDEFLYNSLAIDSNNTLYSYTFTDPSDVDATQIITIDPLGTITGFFFGINYLSTTVPNLIWQEEPDIDIVMSAMDFGFRTCPRRGDDDDDEKEDRRKKRKKRKDD